MCGKLDSTSENELDRVSYINLLKILFMVTVTERRYYLAV